MQRFCVDCSEPFEPARQEISFLTDRSPVFGAQKYLIPPPQSCPDCRQRQRLTWRNERSIHERNSNCCGKSIVSMYRPETPYTVYCHECFWSDKWNPYRHGRPFNFSRSFFEQFNELLQETPLIALINSDTKNSPYCHRIYDGSDNYFSHIALDEPERLIYTHYTIASKDSVDLTYCHSCLECYELVDAENCTRCWYSARIRDCNDSYFCEDCVGCSYCFGCKNLVDKSYCIYNEQVSKTDFYGFLKSTQLDSSLAVERFKQKSQRFFLSLPFENLSSRNCTNVTGANVYDCVNSTEIYDMRGSENLNRCTFGEYCSNSMDCYGFGHSDGCYNSISLLDSRNVFFSATSVHSSELFYCYECYAHSSNLFGCVGLKNARYCILNKQYTSQEYEQLVPRIIEHMIRTGEWGQFFPIDISPFAYNETVAMIYYPTTRAAALRQGLKWYDHPHEAAPTERTILGEELADSIADVPDEIVDWTIRCPTHQRSYRIIPEELGFYRKFNIPLPRLHHEVRHQLRKGRRMERKLWDRQCAKCDNQIKSTYKPTRPEIVYCEKCYYQTVQGNVQDSEDFGNKVGNLT